MIWGEMKRAKKLTDPEATQFSAQISRKPQFDSISARLSESKVKDA